MPDGLDDKLFVISQCTRQGDGRRQVLVVNLGAAKAGVVLDLALRGLDLGHCDVGRRLDDVGQLVAIQVGVCGQGVIEPDRLRVGHDGRNQEGLVRRQDCRHLHIAAEAAQTIEHRCGSAGGRTGLRLWNDSSRQLDQLADGLRHVAQAGIGTALRGRLEGDRSGSGAALDRQLDAYVVAIDLDPAEILVIYSFARRQDGRPQLAAGQLELELVAIHVIAVDDLPARLQRVGIQGASGELEGDFGVKKVFCMRERPQKQREGEQQPDQLIHFLQSPGLPIQDKRAIRW